MAKSSQVIKTVVGIGGALAAVVLSNKGRRDKVKETYESYKEDPEAYKQLAQEKVSQLGTLASDEINKVKSDPKAYVETIKQDPKAFLNDKKERLFQEENVNVARKEADFVDEGGGDPSQNLNEATKEVLKDKNE
ncbi:YtxH domain-containing protein [Staphylococcus americanisciuri]|uniref:YtxH domain-containing protein n=1 Tax=Staphylococcus americanisciuri TaxID=2973940 RepID=A0ABT2F0B0_9STAP|nr:YtxH domain-containing protein [Staphylococcus americanisciuri]MCS4485310.1 YtxH domain-containing protein [Staphylococcus americanisciuri]